MEVHYIKRGCHPHGIVDNSSKTPRITHCAVRGILKVLVSPNWTLLHFASTARKALPDLHRFMTKPWPFRKLREATSQFSTACKRFYRWGQIGHHSEYSIERLLAFQDYYERTSIARALTVCFLAPLPAILVSVLIDCIPLQDPSEGWRANYTFWIRDFLDLFAIALGGTGQTQHVIVADALTNAGVLTASFGTSVIYIPISIAVAAAWRFPVPFGFILLVGPYVATVSVLTILVIGPRAIAKSPTLYNQLKAQAWIVVAQGAVAMVYPLFTAIFYQLSGIQQTVFVSLMPLIKFVAKATIANAAKGLHEYVSTIVVFSVDVFNVLYIAICMQMAKSTLTTVAMMSLDVFHVIVGVRAIFSQMNITGKTRISSNSDSEPSIDCFGEVTAMIDKLLREPQIPIHSRIRVFAPFPLPLSEARTARLREFATSSHEAHAYPPSTSSAAVIRQLTLKSTSSTQGPRCTDVTSRNKNSYQTAKASSSPKFNRVTPASSTALHIGLRSNKTRKGSSPRRLLRLIDSNAAISAGKLRAAISFNATEAAVRDALQALFHAEYLVLAEYIECALPLLYSLYLLVLFHLPAARYYPQTSVPFHKLAGSVTSILIFSVIEFVGFASLLVLLRRKFGISPLYQLAFVLETHIQTIQGHLFVWTIFMLRLPLKHHGTCILSINSAMFLLLCVVDISSYLVLIVLGVASDIHLE